MLLSPTDTSPARNSRRNMRKATEKRKPSEPELRRHSSKGPRAFPNERDVYFDNGRVAIEFKWKCHRRLGV